MFLHGRPSTAEEKDVEASPTPLEDSVPSDSGPDDDRTEEPEGGEGEEEAARPSTPPLVQTILDMGFSRAQVNTAMRRLENCSEFS